MDSFKFMAILSKSGVGTPLEHVITYQVNGPSKLVGIERDAAKLGEVFCSCCEIVKIRGLTVCSPLVWRANING